MTVPVQTPYNSYVYAGSAVFVYKFQIILASDLQVSVAGMIQSAANYTIAGVGSQTGGSITYTGPLTTGQLVELQRVTVLQRSTDYQNEGDFLAATVNADYDRLWMALQEQQRSQIQAIRVPESAGVLPFPPVAARANNLLAFDSLGNPTVSVPAAGTAASVLTLLENASIAAQGSGAVGHGFLLNYPLATVGRALNDLAIQVHDTGTPAGNSNAINAAILVAATGSTIFLPDSMTVDSTVSIVVNKAITIRGSRNKRIQFTSTMGAGFSPIHATVPGVVFEDLWLDGALIENTNNPADTVYYLMSDASDTTVRFCRFTNFPVYRVPCVFLKQDNNLNTSDWQKVLSCEFVNTGGGVLSTTSNTSVLGNVFLESLDTAIAFNGMGARIVTGCVADGNVLVTLQKVGPYLIAIEGATNTTVSSNYAKSVYGQCIAFIDVDPATQTVEYLGTVSGNTFVCETSTDTDPRNLGSVGAFYKGGTFKANSWHGVPGISTNATMLSISMADHSIDDTFDTSSTPTASAYDIIDYQPAAAGAAGSLTVSARANVTRSGRFIGSTSAAAFAAGCSLIIRPSTLVNNGSLASIIVDAPANGAAVDPVVQSYSGVEVVGTAIPTIVNGLSYNFQNITYGREFTLFSGAGSAGKVLRSPAAFTGTNFISDSVTASSTGWMHISCTSSTGGAANFAVLGNGNTQNANNSYGAISDIKLKQDIVDAGSQWADVKALRLRKYRFKVDPAGPLQLGLIAQEAEAVSPGLIEETDDRLMEDGELVLTGDTTKAVKYSVLYLKAMGALQEAMVRIEALEARLEAMGGA